MRVAFPHLRLLLALLCAVWCVPQGLVVLCAGEDGHVAVEVLHPTESATPEGPSHSEEPGECGCRDGCGPCRDTRVGPDLSTSRWHVPPRFGHEPCASAAPAVLAPLRSQRATGAVPVARELPLPEWARHQGSVRLLI